MEKKIKRVKLKKDYCNGFNLICRAGTIGQSLDMECKLWEFDGGSKGQKCFSQGEIFTNPGWFDIEYEPDVKSITVKIEYESESQLFAGNIYNALSNHYIGSQKTFVKNIKVTELPNE